ncbi:thioeseterase [Roseivivax halodurans JCM 10272]|uniref:Thioeseterase n=1 Tax=Roseivivax halodurans JCM 10272 TaxID=1449350 RepID=X7EIP7_9RHOB|nr:acyl-CoA thioesterase [Roseivivax halodurans]ETX15760.1 thioeseterase [Roseivivax halodurans JCM 10272]
MYPFIRLAKESWKFRNAGPLGVGETHVSHHVCWPWDLDLWAELNNGRTLTIYDLGRIPMAQRAGLIGVMREKGWGLTIAGSSVRYRRRVRMMQRIEMRSRVVCWDNRFVYLEQSMWTRNGDCASHALFRSAVTRETGIVPPEDVIAAMGLAIPSPEIPQWIRAWIDAEATRPWPPMQDALPETTRLPA